MDMNAYRLKMMNVPTPSSPIAPPQFAPQNLVQAQPMQSFVPQVAKIKKGGMFGSGLGFGQILAHGLLGAAAANGNTAPLQAYYGNQQREAEAKLAEQNYQRQMRDSLALYEAKARIAAQNQPDPFAKALQFNSLPEEQKRAVANYYDVVNPRMVNGYIPGVGFVQQPIAREVPLSDEEILRMEQGEAGGNASGGFQY